MKMADGSGWIENAQGLSVRVKKKKRSD